MRPLRKFRTMKRHLFLISVMALYAAQAAAASCRTDSYVGSTCWTAANYCPAPDFVEANGASFTQDQYPDLFEVMGEQFGKNDDGEPLLPNLGGRAIAGSNAKLATYSVGYYYGEEEAKINGADSIKNHSHDYSIPEVDVSGALVASTAIGTTTSIDGAVFASRPNVGPAGKRVPMYASSFYFTKDVYMADDALELQFNHENFPQYTENAGSNSAGPSSISVRPPQLALTACVRVNGEIAPKN